MKLDLFDSCLVGGFCLLAAGCLILSWPLACIVAGGLLISFGFWGSRL